MNNTVKLNYILREIETLDDKGKINIISRIVAMLKHAENSPKHSKITELKGLGKDLWRKVDIDDYIEKERSSWI